MEVKDFFYLGAGMFQMAKEKFEKDLEELQEKGKLSKADLDEFIEKSKSRGEEEEKEFKEKLKSIIKDVMDDLGVATKDDIEQLKKELKSN